MDKVVSHMKGRSQEPGTPTSALPFVSCARLGEALSFGFLNGIGNESAVDSVSSISSFCFLGQAEWQVA